ncbi:MAG: 3-isopropylmalate dehydratase large subunit, partial [Alphaproteobacteria bacterium MarineAlpha10_Bin2]
ILPTGCGGCIGLGPARLEENMTGISSTNRNFVGRQGPGARTHLMSPAMAAGAALHGCITDIRKG